MIKKLKRLIINIICFFIPVKSWKIIFREKFLHNVFTSIKPTIKTHYGNIYTPLYNIACPPMGIPPEIYNSDGQRLNVFFYKRSSFCPRSIFE